MRSFLNRSRRNGFTLIELLMFVAIFSGVTISFIAIFISILRIYSRQSSSSEVTRQSNFIMQTFQNQIQRSVTIEMDTDSPTSTLRLRMPEDKNDPTLIYLSGGKIYIQAATGSAQALTNDRVSVTSLTFTKRNNSPGHDSVNLSFSMEYNTSNPQNFFSQNLSAAVARVSAATFDSDVNASSSNTFNLGGAAGNWRSINSTIYFNGGNVGIGNTSPTSPLQLTGGSMYINNYPNGIIQQSANGNCFRLTFTNSGVATGTAVTCP